MPAKDAQSYLIQIANGVTLVPLETQPGWTRFNLNKEDVVPGRLYAYESASGAIDYQRRAGIDYWAYVMPAVLGSGTMYNVAFVDADDHPIDASKNYRVRMPKDFPARSFWSVFAYDGITRTFANRDKGRHLSSLDNLQKNADGSTDIYIGPSIRRGLESNWIETIPGIEVFIGLRTYGPEKLCSIAGPADSSRTAHEPRRRRLRNDGGANAIVSKKPRNNVAFLLVRYD